MHFSIVSYAGLVFLSFASALIARDSPEVNEKFGLYAYGDAVGGLSLFYAGGVNCHRLINIEVVHSLTDHQARP